MNKLMVRGAHPTWLNLTHPLSSFEQLLRRFNTEDGGNAGSKLYDKVIEFAKAQTQRPTGACFVAGTLVHTRDGLVPIEKIQVGDWVLSKHESGEGEQSYQRVTRTFVHEEQPVLCVDLYGWSEEEHLHAEATHTMLDYSRYFPLVVTANHPFWVVGKGWVQAQFLCYGVDILQMADGSQRMVYDKSDVVRTLHTDLGWLVGGTFCPIKFDNVESRWIDFRNGAVYTSYIWNDRILNEGVEWERQGEADRMRRTVYNIEVENTHTYYVGKQGVWVHNKHLQPCRVRTAHPYG